MVPTYEFLDPIAADWSRLTPTQRAQFRTARDQMISDMMAGRGFRNGLRVKGIQGAGGVFEMTWSPNGRATFSYGPQLRPGNPHIIWRRIGTHDIFTRP
ncbi:MAG: hypothetical protein FWD59_06695 [Micrococcales bacterium]|nr:hypothetical protein [Micrococcales bacterium]